MTVNAAQDTIALDDRIKGNSQSNGDAGQDSSRQQDVNSSTDIGSVTVNNSDKGSQDKSFDSITDIDRETKTRAFRTKDFKIVDGDDDHVDD